MLRSSAADGRAAGEAAAANILCATANVCAHGGTAGRHVLHTSAVDGRAAGEASVVDALGASVVDGRGAR